MKLRYLAPCLIFGLLCLLVFPVHAMEQNTDRPGMDYRNFDLRNPDPKLCEQACIGDAKCKAFTYVKPGVQGPKARCWLKHGVPAAKPGSCCISGVISAGRRPVARPSGKSMVQHNTPKPKISTGNTGTKPGKPQLDPQHQRKRESLKRFDRTWKSKIKTTPKQMNAHFQSKVQLMQKQHESLINRNRKTLQSLEPDQVPCMGQDGAVHPCPPANEDTGPFNPEITNHFAATQGLNKNIMPGDVVLIGGRHFGKEKGDFILHSKGVKIPHTVNLWTPGVIMITIGDKIPGLTKPLEASFGVRRKGFTGMGWKEVTFVPHMIVTTISGLKYFKADNDGEKGFSGEQASGVLLVTHDPGCSWMGFDQEGNDGNDWFFKHKKLPSHVTVLDAKIALVDPDYGGNVLGLVDFGHGGANAAWYMLSEGVEKIDEGLNIVTIGLGFFFDSNAGSYGINVKEEDDAVRVFWSNSCWGKYDGLDVKYVASFLVMYPEGTPAP